MSKKEKKTLPINVTLSGDDLDKFLIIKNSFVKKHYLGTDAELLRMCLRFYYENYEQIIDLNGHKSFEDFKEKLELINQRLIKIEKKLLE